MARKTINQILGEYTSPRTYFDNGCHEFTKKHTWEVKLQKLAMFLHEGHDLMFYLRKYINYYYKRDGYAHMLGSLEQTLNMYIWYIQTGQPWKHLKINHFKEDKYELIAFFESELRKDMANHPEKYPFLSEKKRVSGRFRWYKKYELVQLLSAYLQSDSSYYKAVSEQLGLDITKDNRSYIDLKNQEYFTKYADQIEIDSNFKVKFDYTHLHRILLDFIKAKKNSGDYPRVDMGCAPNQIFYFVKRNYLRDRSSFHQDEWIYTYPIVIELLQIIYGKKKQPFITYKANFFDLENWEVR